MKQVRYGVFESNSSSMHSIAIPKNVDRATTFISVGFDEYGWEFDEADPLAYLHTAIYEVYDKNNAKEKVKELADILERNGIESDFMDPQYGEYGFDSGYIDHGNELGGFLEELFNDEDLLVRYINGGRVFTGNDNSGPEELAFVFRDKPTYDEWDRETKEYITHDNPYYMGEGYQWFHKYN